MEKMDQLWTDQFDKAFKRIPEDSAFAYKRYADFLDKLFVYYWEFLRELHKKGGPSHDKLVKVSDELYKKSTRHAEKVW